ncbi:hypothetical protein V4U86_10975 [Mycobacterium sp. AMU20-3851]|uniref:hypothetical protein n=1 Tax=Mycobacterium sp. AMU20-3851 TaxID=3122055 RepID=UPI00375511FB
MTTWPRALRVSATAVVIAAAAVLWHNLPTPDDVYGPFDVHAGIGEPAAGRAITAEVNGIRIAPRIRKMRGTAPVVDAVGIWVAVDGEVMSTRFDEVPNVELLVGPNTYVPTDRLGYLPMTGSLAPGIAVRSSWVFDLPSDLVAASQQMTLRVWVRDGRMDSRLVVDLPLAGPSVSRSDLIVIEPEEVVGT